MRLLEAFALDMGVRSSRLFVILATLILYFKLPREYFTSRHTLAVKDSSILRLLYYPPLSPNDNIQAGGDIRAGVHTDYGTLTLLFQAWTSSTLEF